MISRAEQLATHRRALQLRCALQRQQVAYMTAAIESKLGPADRAFGIVSSMRKNPLIAISAIGGLMLIGPWRLIRWASQGAFLLNAAKKILSLFGK